MRIRKRSQRDTVISVATEQRYVMRVYYVNYRHTLL